MRAVQVVGVGRKAMKEFQGVLGFFRYLRYNKPMAAFLLYTASHLSTSPTQREMNMMRSMAVMKQDIDDDFFNVDPKFRRKPYSWEERPGGALG